MIYWEISSEEYTIRYSGFPSDLLLDFYQLGEEGLSHPESRVRFFITRQFLSNTGKLRNIDPFNRKKLICSRNLIITSLIFLEVLSISYFVQISLRYVTPFNHLKNRILPKTSETFFLNSKNPLQMSPKGKQHTFRSTMIHEKISEINNWKSKRNYSRFSWRQIFANALEEFSKKSLEKPNKKYLDFKYLKSNS